MILLLMADWLNSTFSGFDYSILKFYHDLAESTNNGLGWLFRAITATAEHGYGMIFMSLLMILIPLVPVVRKKAPAKCKLVFVCGVVAFTAIILGFLVTNLAIKETVGRQRPYLSSDVFKQWWEFAKGNLDPEYSFPSGHTTCTMAVMMSIFLCGNRKKSWLALVYAVLMGATRNYLMMHYPTDIIGGLIVGGLASAVAYIIWVGFIFKRTEASFLNKIFKE